MTERRRQKRFAAQYPVTVYNTRTDEPFGQLIDLSCEGMRIISDHPTEDRDRYHLSLDLPAPTREPGLPEEMEVTEHVSISATSVWCDQLMNSRNFDSGLHLIDPDPDTVSAIRTAFQDALFLR